MECQRRKSVRSEIYAALARLPCSAEINLFAEKGAAVGLEELKKQFIVSEDAIANQLEGLVGTLKDHVVVSESGDVHLLDGESTPVKVRLQLALSARIIASKLDGQIRSAVSLDQLQKYVGVPREQLRARVSELVRDHFVESKGDGLYEAAAHRVDGFVRSLSAPSAVNDRRERARSKSSRRVGARKPAIVAKRQRTQLVDLLHRLVDAGFFSEPKDLRAIQMSLADSGHHYPVTTLSGAMLREVRRRNLRRMKQANLWTYVNA